MQVVTQLEGNLQKEKERLHAMMQHLHMNPSDTLAPHNTGTTDGLKNNTQHSIDTQQHNKKCQLVSQPPTPSVITPTRSFSSASLPGLLPTGTPRSPKSPQPPLHSSSQNSSPTPSSATSKRRVSESAKVPGSSGQFSKLPPLPPFPFILVAQTICRPTV